MVEYFSQIDLSGNINIVHFLLAFGAGVLMSFSPCVYPLLPITIGVITEESIIYRTKGFFLTLVFVSGVAVTYAFLGLMAAATGIWFGKISSHPLAQFAVGMVIIVFALYSLELIKIPLPNISLKKKHKGGAVIPVFIMGLVSGLAIGPCTAPALGAILTYVASRKNLLYAVFLLMSFAYGMGFVLIIAGTFSGLLANIPKQGKWMHYVKKFMGIVLLGWGLYFIFVGIGRLK